LKYLIAFFVFFAITFGAGKALQRAIEKPSLTNTMAVAAITMMGSIAILSLKRN